jgi:hypothetical protein
MLCESECIWDLKWHPSPGNARAPSATDGGTLGCLAVARGDGAILLLSVPWTRRSSTQPPHVIEVTPIMRCQPGQSLAWVLAWSSKVDEHTRLFFGCQDGTVGLIDTLTRPSKSDQLAVPELTWQAHSGSVRRCQSTAARSFCIVVAAGSLCRAVTYTFLSHRHYRP